jgi:dinuclear metal center YbgI/SA1388 family protein
MAVELEHLIDSFEKLWPLAGAESWDSPGLVAGNPRDRISRVLLSVDVTAEIMSEAIDGEFDLVLAHHPFLLKGVTSLAEQTSKGSTLAAAIRNAVAIYAAHTNADIVQNGVSHVLAKSLGIQTPIALVQDAADFHQHSPEGHGRIGDLASPIKLGDFARLIAKILPSTATGIRVAGDFEMLVQRVAVCGGAGDSFIGAAIAAGADVFVTSDLRHHPTQDAREHALLNDGKPALIDVAHWASEWLWLEIAAEQLGKAFPSIQFVVSQIRTDPWDFVVTQ